MCKIEAKTYAMQTCFFGQDRFAADMQAIKVKLMESCISPFDRELSTDSPDAK